VIAEDAAAPVAPSALVPSLLREYGAATRDVLFRYLPDAEPRRYLYDLVADYPKRGGRGFRPTLCIATARAFGAPMEQAILTAASIEMIHNAMLVHDDIEDGSEQRRGRPTLHAAEGVPMAINAGDMMSMLALQPLLDNRARLGPYLAMRILEETERMARESAEGQAMELGWRRDNVTDVGEADYLEMVLKKTCWLLSIHPTRVGALIATGGSIGLDRFIRFGFFLGAAFQIQDDLLNLEGDPEAYGKELGGDLYEGKRTLILIRFFDRAEAAERERLRRLLATEREERDPGEIRWLRSRLDDYGCVEFARQVAHGLAGAARHEFTRTFGDLPESRDKQFIEALPYWVLERS